MKANTGTLHIERLKHIAPGSWAVRFTGPRAEFGELVDDLRNEGREYARWDATAFDGRGGWLIDEQTLLYYKDRFDNLERRLQFAREQEARRDRC